MNFKQLTDCPYYLISRVSLMVTSELKKGFIEADIKAVKPAYLGVLIALWIKDGQKVISLGKKAGLEPSSMTGLIDRMERDGLVTRTPDENDRRVLRIHLTGKAKDLKDPVAQVIDRTFAQTFAGISDQELAQTQNTLRKILQNANKGML